MRFALFGSRKGKAKGSASHTPSARAVAQQGGTEFVVAPAVGRRTATTTTSTPSAMTDISPWACSTRASQAPVRMASLPATLTSAKEHTVGEGSLSRQSTQRGGAGTMRPQRVVSAPGKLQSPPPPVTPPRARWTLASRAFLGHHPPSQHAREEVVTPAVLAVAPADHERRGSGAYIEFPLEARGTGSVVPPPLYKPRAQTKGTTRPSHSNQPRRSYSLERTRSLARKHTGGGAKSERENEWGACDARASEVTSEIEWAPPPSWWSSRASSRASVDSSCKCISNIHTDACAQSHKHTCAHKHTHTHTHTHTTTHTHTQTHVLNHAIHCTALLSYRRSAPTPTLTAMLSLTLLPIHRLIPIQPHPVPGADSQPATSARSSFVSTASSPLYVSSIGGPSITPDARGFERDAEDNDNLVKECATNTTNVSPLVAPKTNTMTTVAPLVTPEAMENRRFSVVEHVGSVTRASSSSSSSSSDVDTTSVSLNESVEQRQRQPQPQQFRSRSLDALRRSSAMTSSLESIREEDGDTYATLEEVANPLPR